MELPPTTRWIKPGKWGGGTASTHCIPNGFPLYSQSGFCHYVMSTMFYVLTCFNVKHLWSLSDEEIRFLRCPFTALLGAVVRSPSRHGLDDHILNCLLKRKEESGAV